MWEGLGGSSKLGPLSKKQDLFFISGTDQLCTPCAQFSYSFILDSELRNWMDIAPFKIRILRQNFIVINSKQNQKKNRDFLLSHSSLFVVTFALETGREKYCAPARHHHECLEVPVQAASYRSEMLRFYRHMDPIQGNKLIEHS